MHTGVASSLAFCGWWLGNIVSGELSPILLSSTLGTAGTLLLHATVCAIVVLFVLLLIPETKVLDSIVNQLLHTVGYSNAIFHTTCIHYYNNYIYCFNSRRAGQ